MLFLQFDLIVELSFILGAVCASAATYIVAEVASQRQDVSIQQYRNGQFMIHNVSANLNGDIKNIKSKLVLMENLQANIVKAYVDLTGMDEDDIVDMMDNETWLSAKDALDKGFITKIIDKNDNMPDNSAGLKNYYSNIPNELSFVSNQTSKKMNDEQLKLLNLPADATDEQITSALKTLTEKNQELENSAKQAHSDKIKVAVNNAIKDGRIKKEDAEKWTNLLNADYDAAIDVLNSVKSNERFKISDAINNHAIGDVQDWDYYINKNPEYLNSIQKSDWELFSQLYKNKYGEEPVK